MDSTLTSGTAQILDGGGPLTSPGVLNMNGTEHVWKIFDGADAVDMRVSVSIQNGGLIKDDEGTLVLTMPSSFVGTARVEAGTLAVADAGALTGTGSVVVRGGTFLLSSTAANRINDTAAVSLGGTSSAAKFVVSGAVTETMGALSLTSGSGFRVLDFGATSGVLTFASIASGAGSLPLQIWNWSGTERSGGGTDQLIISPGTLGANIAMSDITFYSDNGATAYTLGTGWTGAGNELAPIPEARSVFTAFLLLGCIGWHERRRLTRTSRSQVARA